MTITNGLISDEIELEDDKGGAIYCENASPVIENCILTNNTVNRTYSYNGCGGAIACISSNSKIIRCVITGNYAKGGAGWMAFPIAADGADGCGGAIYLNDNSNVIVENCTICNNTAKGGKGNDGDCVESYPANGGDSFGGGIYSESSSSIIKNCIIYNNQVIGGDPGINYCGSGLVGYSLGPQVYGTAHVTYSDVQGGWSGLGNINADPLFVDTVGGDYHLKSEAGRWDPIVHEGQWVFDNVTSPCIDAGDPASDWKKEFWPHGGRVNMGAYGGTAEASMSTDTSVGNIADLNLDGKVDLLDYDRMTDWWRKEEFLLKEDLSRNGRVDAVDLEILCEKWLWEE